MCGFQNILRIIASCIGIIAILAPVLSLLLKPRHQTGRSTGTGTLLRRWPVVLLTTLAFIALGILLWKPLPLHFTTTSACWLDWLGFLMYFPAVCLYLWGFLTLGRNFGVSTSGGADIHSDQDLVTSGPFRFSRHPMYFGVLLAAWGAFLLFRTWAMLIFLPMSFVVIRRARHEEKLLAEAFGEAWRVYSSRVPMWIPLLKRKGKSRQG